MTFQLQSHSKMRVKQIMILALEKIEFALTDNMTEEKEIIEAFQVAVQTGDFTELESLLEPKCKDCGRDLYGDEPETGRCDVCRN